MTHDGSRLTDRAELDRSAFLFLGSVLTLLALGVVMVYSAAGVEAATGRHGDGSTLRPFVSHAIKVAVGVVLMLGAARLDPRSLVRWAKPAWLVAVALLALVLVPGIGVESNGSRRWLNTQRFLGFGLQPSELAKMALVVVLAAWAAKVGDVGASFRKTFLPGAALVLVPAALILLETDFGTCLLLSALGFLLLLLAGARVNHLGLLVVLGIPLVALFLWINPGTHYIFRRIDAFADGWSNGSDAASAGATQVAYAQEALRIGGLTGVGLGAGRLKLFFLAEAENDFILAVIGEELGFVGTTAVLLLFALLLWSGRRLLLGMQHRFGFFVMAGVLIIIAIQALMNVFVAVRWAPVKGIPLPFVSSGGSSLTVLCLGVGIVLACARHAEADDPVLGPAEPAGADDAGRAIEVSDPIELAGAPR